MVCTTEGRLAIPPNIYLDDKLLVYVKSFKYLGHIICSNLRDEDDINREIRNLYARGNTIIRKFSFAPVDVKCTLFKSFCYSLFSCSLWANARRASLYKLNVCYNNIMRKLLNVPPWQSVRPLFAELNIRSFGETIRNSCNSLLNRVSDSRNFLIETLVASDARTLSIQWRNWESELFVYIPNSVLPLYINQIF